MYYLGDLDPKNTLDSNHKSWLKTTFNISNKDIALIFDNNKVFHRTPPTQFWNWITNNMPSKRRVTQFRISWDDYDQVEEFNPERFQEIMGGGGYSIS